MPFGQIPQTSFNVRHCGAVTALGLKYGSAVTFPQVRTGMPAGTRVRLQCPLVDCALKGMYKRVSGTAVLGFISANDFYKISLFKEAIILNGTSIFIYLPSDESEVLQL